MKQLLLLPVLLFAAQATFAEDIFAKDPNDTSHFYGGVGLSYTDTSDCGYGYVECKGNGWKLLGGYQFNTYTAVEAAYQRFFRSSGDTEGYYTVVDATGMSLAAKGSYPVNPKTDVFGKVGFMTWDATASLDGVTAADSTDTDLLLGVGADYKFNDNWGLRGELEHVGGDLKAKTMTVSTVFSTL